MLKELKINNIAIIDECLISFDNGFNVLTGETGAGKSIIIDSLEFVLGARADKTLIKAGTSVASVSAVFDVSDISNKSSIYDVLGMEYDDILVISRSMTNMGKNECRINGQLTSVSVLRKITGILVDIFGQHDSVALLDEKNHLALLDSVNHALLQPHLDKLITCINSIHDIDTKIKELGGLGTDRERNIDILKYQIDEILAANLDVNEEQELTNKLDMMSNSEKIAESLDSAISALDSEGNISGILKLASSSLDNLEKYGESCANLAQRLNSVRYEIEDILTSVQNLRKDIDFSESQINALIDRLEQIKDLKRKYGSSVSQVLDYLATAQNKLDLLINAEANINSLINEKNNILKEASIICQNITSIRKDIANKMSYSVVEELKDLGMKNARFVVDFKDYDVNNISDYLTPTGADSIEFLFSANLGVPPAPISKIISGGEMSRFMLALKCVTGGENKTYVFDEIDTGIGGDVGAFVALKLAKISKSSQVLCVTHLAQIACFGDVNFLIKKTENEITRTSVVRLDNTAKEQEITRMIGRIGGDEFARQHAKELIKDASKLKQNLNNK